MKEEYALCIFSMRYAIDSAMANVIVQFDTMLLLDGSPVKLQLNRSVPNFESWWKLTEKTLGQWMVPWVSPS